jgi:hypothetical protein
MIVHDDIIHWASTYDGPRFHALLCDAPYEMQFMGKDWDNTGIASNPEMWRAVAQHLHPGAYLFVFCGTLNDDLISMAMRAAGLRKHHKALAWGYGSGFPKATRLDVAIDRRAGAARATVSRRKHAPKFDAAGHGYREKDNGYNSKERESFDVTAPATALAQTWAGHRYGLQALKPAVEPILVFQKPYAKDALDSITATGAGALNIDQARIGTEDVNEGEQYLYAGNNGIAMGAASERLRRNGGGAQHPDGRWPANLLLSHTPTCNGTCAPGCPVAGLGAQSGQLSSGGFPERHGVKDEGVYGQFQGEATGREGHLRSQGTAARFFHQSDYMYERLEDADAVIYEAKASQGEREAGLDPRQLALLGMLDREEATINDGREKPIDNPYQRGETTRRNIHPTIKPIALARHLATLLLPPDAYAPRRLLIPFAGAGSEMIGAMLAGWEEVVGVELEADHVAIAEARLAYWRQRLHEFGDPAKEVRATLAAAPAGQIDMFEEHP